MRRSALAVVLVSLLVVSLAAPISPASGASQAPAPIRFDNLEQAGGALMRLGCQTVSAWERRERAQQKRQAIVSLLGVALMMGLGAWTIGAANQPFYNLFPSAISDGMVFSGAWSITQGVMIAGGSAIGREQTMNAVMERAGDVRASYAVKSIVIAPENALAATQEIPDAARRGKLLAVMLAAASTDAPQAAQPIAEALLTALKATRDLDDNVATVITVLPVCESLGHTHPATTACVSYVADALAGRKLNLAPPDMTHTLKVYLHFRPEEAPRLISRIPAPNDRSAALLAAAEGALETGDSERAATLLRATRREISAIKSLRERVDALAAVAASPAAGEAREDLVSEATTEARSAGSKGDVERLTRMVALRLAAKDLHSALSGLMPPEVLLQDPAVARDLVGIALRSAPSEEYVTLIEKLPRKRELASCLRDLAMAAAQARIPALQAAAATAAQAALALAPSVGDEKLRRRVMLDCLSMLAYLDPRATRFTLRGLAKDRDLAAAAHLRAASAVAAKALTLSQELERRDSVDTATRILRDGFALVNPEARVDRRNELMREVGPAISMVSQVAPAETRAIADKLPPGVLRAEALLHCALGEAMADSPTANETLARALTAAREVADREMSEIMLSRVYAVLSLTDTARAQSEIDKLKHGWMRVAALATAATARHARRDSGWLESVAASTEAARAMGDLENRAKVITWILDVAATKPDDCERQVRCAGLPWFLP